MFFFMFQRKTKRYTKFWMHLKQWIIILRKSGIRGLSMIYAMSDIHGCCKVFQEMLGLIDLDGDNRLILLGDYIDYGRESGSVLSKVYELQQKYGSGKVTVLKGNHEKMLLDWIDDFDHELTKQEQDLVYDTWLTTDSEYGYNTFRTLICEEDLEQFLGIEKACSFARLNSIAVNLILKNNRELIEWIRKMPSYYETQNQIFIHAGVDEEAGEYWKWGSDDDMFLGKFPASAGKFIKTIIAGHVGTGSLARDGKFHDIYFDGASHYYIDGSVYKHGKLLLMGYDEKTDKYYQIEKDSKVPVRKFFRD